MKKRKIIKHLQVPGIISLVLLMSLLFYFFTIGSNTNITGYAVLGEQEEQITPNTEPPTEREQPLPQEEPVGERTITRRTNNNEGIRINNPPQDNQEPTKEEPSRGRTGAKAPKPLPELKVKDGKGTTKEQLQSTFTEQQNGNYELAFKGKLVKNFYLRNLQAVGGEPLTIRLDEDSETLKEKSKYPWKRMYALDPTNLEFSDGALELQAQGEQLYKCKAWNYQLQRCEGRWIKLQDITPGTDYQVYIDQFDPGFAETGIASINTNKSLYRPGEQANISIAVLNTTGYLVSNAELYLEIANPNNDITTYTTENFTEISKGIYQTTFDKTQLEGSYSMYVEATGTGVNNSMISEFYVEQNYDYDIIRTAPMSIDPWKGPYNTSILVTSYTTSNTFTLKEKIPTNFTITNTGGGTITTYEDYQELRYENITNNTIITYQTQTPLITPALYKIGKAVIEDEQQNFTEARHWHLAIDPEITYENDSRGTPNDPNSTLGNAGNITPLTIGGESITSSWQGYYGNITGTLHLQDANNNTLYNWSTNNPSGEVYATRSATITFENIRCANETELTNEEQTLGQETTDEDSVKNTFTQNNHPTFYSAQQELTTNTCNSTNLYDQNGAQTTKFFELLLSDGQNMIYTALLEQSTTGFDNKEHDFEMIVGENGHEGNTETTTYYFYTELH